jgi:hypothetical protein
MIEDIKENHTVPDFDTALLLCRYLDIEVDWGWLRLITEIVDFRKTNGCKMGVTYKAIV